VTDVRGDLSDGWLRYDAGLGVSMTRRGRDHHHDGDRDHQHPGGSGQARHPGVLPAYHGRHLGYPVSLVTPMFPVSLRYESGGY
jgi:hypothetical protein